MDVQELNKSQLIMLAILLSFIVSIATGITTVSLMDRAPASFTTPINRVVRQTVEKIVPTEIKDSALSDEQVKLLEQLKAIKPLTISVFVKGPKGDGSDDKLLGTGLFLGENKVVVASELAEPKEGEVYVLKSVLGEQKVSKVRVEKDFSIIEIAQSSSEPSTVDPSPTDTPIDTIPTPAE